ncbi:hypothetical protein B1A90_05185 [Neisseria meningitidis]|nr:hypothetical protein B1A90_05185 [Neisseria meningitidis]
MGLPLQHGFFRFYVLDSRLRGNDGRAVSVFSDKCRNLKSRHSHEPTSRHSHESGNLESRTFR